MLFKFIIFWLVSLGFSQSAFGHAGGTDLSGGHYNRKTGAYHKHNAGRSGNNPYSGYRYPYSNRSYNRSYNKQRSRNTSFSRRPRSKARSKSRSKSRSKPRTVARRQWQDRAIDFTYKKIYHDGKCKILLYTDTLVDRDTLVKVIQTEEEDLVWFYMPGMHGSLDPWATAKKQSTSPGNVSCSFKTKNLSTSTTFLLRGVVKSVLTGDRIVVQFDQTRFKIKLWGVDAPAFDSKYFEPSKDHLSDLCRGEDVLVYCRSTNGDGEFLGVVECDDQDINSQMIADGFAVSASNETGLNKSVLEENAFKSRKGLWNELDWQKLHGRYLQSF